MNSSAIALAMIVGEDAVALARCLESVAELVGEVHVLTSADASDVERVIAAVLGPIEAGAVPWRRVVHEPWQGYAAARTRALQLADEGSAQWVLMLDADMTAWSNPELTAWLAGDPLPHVNAWEIEVREHGTSYRLPLLTRRNVGACYLGPTHEALLVEGRYQQLSGLVIEHHADGVHREGKLERDLELLAPGVLAGEPRAVYYSAQAYRDLGETERAIGLYRRRAAMGGWEEEAWHAEYRAAQLAGDVDALIRAWRRRPWRHEPLTAAAQLARERGADSADALFLEP